MKFDLKSIEAMTDVVEMKSVMTALANEIADIEAKLVQAGSTAQAKEEARESRKKAVRAFLNSAPAKSTLADFSKQLDLATAGNTIEQQLSKEIIELAVLNTQFLQEIGNQTVSSTDFRQLVLRARPTVAQTTEQNGTNTAVAATGTQDHVEVTALFSKVFAMPILTHEILRDAHIDVEAELMRLIAEEWSFKLVDMLMFGDGTKTIGGVQNLRGLLNARLDLSNGYAEAVKADKDRSPEVFQVVKSGVEGALGTDAAATQDFLIDLQAALPQKYQSKAKWYMNLKTFSTLKKLRTTDGHPVIEFGKFSVSGAAWGEGYVLLGRPIVIIDQMPNIGHAVFKTPVVYGDLGSAFKMVPLAGSDHYIVDEVTTKGAKTIYLDQRFGEIIGVSDAVRFALTAA